MSILQRVNILMQPVGLITRGDLLESVAHGR
jgi:hypothetical protein